MSTETKPLSPRHERFVLEYLKDANATQAYIRAGYSRRGAQPSASRLLRDPAIAAALAAGHQRITEALEVSAERVAREYAKIAYACITDFVTTDEDGRLRVDLEKAGQAQRAGIVELWVGNHSKPEHQQVRIKLGKLQALAALDRRLERIAARAAPQPAAQERGLAADIAAARQRVAEHERQQPLAAEAELARTRQALAEAEAKLKAQAGPPRVEAPEEQLGPNADEQRRIQAMCGGGYAPTTAAEQRPSEPPQRPRGLPLRDTPEFADLLARFRRGTLDYHNTQLMIQGGYGLEEDEPDEPDMTYQMQCEYEIKWD